MVCYEQNYKKRRLWRVIGNAIILVLLIVVVVFFFLAVTICDNRAARRWRRKFKSGCTPIFLYIYIYTQTGLERRLRTVTNSFTHTMRSSDGLYRRKAINATYIHYELGHRGCE